MNFVIIEYLDIVFEVGMMVLIGEIGVGKLIIIDVVGLLVGGCGLVEFIWIGVDKVVL